MILNKRYVKCTDIDRIGRVSHKNEPEVIAPYNSFLTDS